MMRKNRFSLTIPTGSRVVGREVSTSHLVWLQYLHVLKGWLLYVQGLDLNVGYFAKRLVAGCYYTRIMGIHYCHCTLCSIHLVPILFCRVLKLGEAWGRPRAHLAYFLSIDEMWMYSACVRRCSCYNPVRGEIWPARRRLLSPNVQCNCPFVRPNCCSSKGWGILTRLPSCDFYDCPRTHLADGVSGLSLLSPGYHMSAAARELSVHLLH